MTVTGSPACPPTASVPAFDEASYATGTRTAGSDQWPRCCTMPIRSSAASETRPTAAASKMKGIRVCYENLRVKYCGRVNGWKVVAGHARGFGWATGPSLLRAGPGLASCTAPIRNAIDSPSDHIQVSHSPFYCDGESRPSPEPTTPQILDATTDHSALGSFTYSWNLEPSAVTARNPYSVPRPLSRHHIALRLLRTIPPRPAACNNPPFVAFSPYEHTVPSPPLQLPGAARAALSRP